MLPFFTEKCMKKYDAVLLLGLKLRPDGTPEKALMDRVRLAAQLMEKGCAPMVIPCGGQTENTPVAESEVMARELEKLGVMPEKIVQENASLYTVQNIRNAKAMLEEQGIYRPRVILVTSDYHAFRAAHMARSMGMKVKSIPSPTPNDALKRRRRKLECFYFINYITGWETGRRKRPAWYDKAVKRLQK